MNRVAIRKTLAEAGIKGGKTSADDELARILGRLEKWELRAPIFNSCYNNFLRKLPL